MLRNVLFSSRSVGNLTKRFVWMFRFFTWVATLSCLLKRNRRASRAVSRLNLEKPVTGKASTEMGGPLPRCACFCYHLAVPVSWNA